MRSANSASPGVCLTINKVAWLLPLKDREPLWTWQPGYSADSRLYVVYCALIGTFRLLPNRLRTLRQTECPASCLINAGYVWFVTCRRERERVCVCGEGVCVGGGGGSRGFSVAQEHCKDKQVFSQILYFFFLFLFSFLLRCVREGGEGGGERFCVLLLALLFFFSFFFCCLFLFYFVFICFVLLLFVFSVLFRFLCLWFND